MPWKTQKKHLSLLNCCFTILLLINNLPAQIIDLDRQPVYQRVFVDTDDFDTSYLTQLAKAIKIVQIDSVQYALQNDHAYYWHTRNLTKAKTLIEQAIRELGTKSSLWQGRFQITQGAILLRAEKLDSASLVLHNAKEKVLPVDLPMLYTQLSYVWERRGELDKAMDFAFEALKVGQDLNDQKAIAQAYSDLSYLFYKQSKFDKALDYGLRAEKLFELRGIHDLDYSFTLYIIGVYYHAIKNQSEALRYYEASIAISEQYGFYNNLSDAYVDLSDLYTEMDDYLKALDVSAQAIKYGKLLNNNFLQMRGWLSLGRLQNLSNNSKEAIKSLKQSLSAATTNFGDEYWLHQVYQQLGEAYSQENDYKSAYEAFLAYDQLKDNIFTEEADRRVTQLQTEFEVAQKETTISNQKLQLQQQQRVQFLTIGIVILLSMFLIGLYRNYQLNKRNSQNLSRLNLNLEQKNQQLDIKNQENVVLLKEIHHRVKNNLQVLSSLLSLQSDYITDPAALDAVREGRNRVQSMGLLHQKLYTGKNLASVNIQEYVPELLLHLKETFGVSDNINFDFSAEVNHMDIDTAIPMGLIINELVTNSLKYAFPANTKGNIKIRLSINNTEDILTLVVADDGLGASQSTDPAISTNFGTDLVKVLSKKLKGKIQQTTENGFCTIIQFRRFHLNKMAPQNQYSSN